MSQIHGTILLSTPGQFGPVVLSPQLSKNDVAECCFLKQFGFEICTNRLEIIKVVTLYCKLLVHFAQNYYLVYRNPQPILKLQFHLTHVNLTSFSVHLSDFSKQQNILLTDFFQINNHSTMSNNLPTFIFLLVVAFYQTLWHKIFQKMSIKHSVHLNLKF